MCSVEIVKRSKCVVKNNELIERCRQFLHGNDVRGGRIITDFKSNSILDHNIKAIIVEFDEEANEKIKGNFLSSEFVKWYIYRLDGHGPEEDYISHDDENISMSTNRVLPSKDLHLLWENLIYDKDIKEKLLRFVETTLFFSLHQVDTNVISANRMVLLHGPPGTGKTSLCRALAHKCASRLRDVYPNAHLVEVNSHSVFSKWFSESGKLVTKMFTHIRELSSDPNSLVFVLIDEVESLARARTQAMSGTDPSDAVRVVNAVLTQIDQMARFKNVLILTTSNMTGAIDLAFVDRADIKQFIGLPTPEAIYQIYNTCLQELLRCGIIHPRDVILPVHAIKISNDDPEGVSGRLLDISYASVGLSGRSLRKIPFLAYALYLRNQKYTLIEFLDAMKMAVMKQKQDIDHFNDN